MLPPLPALLPLLHPLPASPPPPRLALSLPPPRSSSAPIPSPTRPRQTEFDFSPRASGPLGALRRPPPSVPSPSPSRATTPLPRRSRLAAGLAVRFPWSPASACSPAAFLSSPPSDRLLARSLPSRRSLSSRVSVIGICRRLRLGPCDGDGGGEEAGRLRSGYLKACFVD
ncbi:uncharacterized protein A4U43_C05F18770 [Asparagus officinalis]|uniref:Uncharacterized protein n=1 Tax=Asparagus officinalis TaxID=4686 RepID=A0A5P1EY12_ASPOF|nr:uncharacterized protein A4U43_C05F18770 [Asparagus officinalis]